MRPIFVGGKHHHHVHKLHFEDVVLLLRNLFVSIATLLFVASLLPDSVLGEAGHYLRGAAYCIGACAYVTEILDLTHNFHKHQSAKVMYMPVVFGALYILLGIRYFLH